MDKDGNGHGREREENVLKQKPDPKGSDGRAWEQDVVSMSGDPAKGCQGVATSTITAVWRLSSWQPGGQEAGAEQASYARGGRHKVKVRTETGVLSPGGTDSAGERVGDMGTTSRLLTLYQPELREKRAEASVLSWHNCPLTHDPPHPSPPQSPWNSPLKSETRGTAAPKTQLSTEA